MELRNISLWFAKDESGEIITIDKIKDEYEGKYYCPLCGSEIIPKALNSVEVSPHFAHIDRSKCSGESIVHYWVKNELMKKDDVFEVVTNESTQYMCKEILFEQSYETHYGIYKPDITVITYKDEKIFIEVNYTNKKKVENYYLKWKHLGCTVVEFGIDNLHDSENKVKISNSFKAIYFKGSMFSINKCDNEYVSYIKSIENKVSENYTVKLKEIEWFLDDIYKYSIGALNIADLTYEFDYLIRDKDCETKRVVLDLYKNSKCNNALMDIVKHKDNVCNKIVQSCHKELGFKNVFYNSNAKERLIFDRIFNKNIIRIGIQDFYDSVKRCDSIFKSKYFDDDHWVNIDVCNFTDEYFVNFKININNIVSRYISKSKTCNFIKTILNMHEVNNFDISVKYSSIVVKAMWKGCYRLYDDGTISYNDINLCKTNINNEEQLLKDFEFALGYTEVGGNYIFNRNIIDLYEKLVSIYSKTTNEKYTIKIDNSRISIHKYKEIASFNYKDCTQIDEVMAVFSKAVRNHIYNTDKGVYN